MKPAQTPRAMAMADALAGSTTLGMLLAHARMSRECMQAVSPALTTTLAAHLRPGPCQDGLWVVLATNGQAAAKARQLLPRMLEMVQARGLAVNEVKVRVSPPVPGL